VLICYRSFCYSIWRPWCLSITPISVLSSLVSVIGWSWFSNVLVFENFQQLSVLNINVAAISVRNLITIEINLLLSIFVIRLEARLQVQPNVGFTLGRVLAVFTRSAIGLTPPKVNRFGWNLEHSEYIVGCWPWQIFGAIRAVATAGEPGDFLSG